MTGLSRYGRVGLAACGLCIACGGDVQPPDVVRWDSEGIEVVMASDRDRPLDWTFERDFSLGGEEEGAESFYWLTSMNVDTDRGGRIFVLNPSEHQVVVFTPEGQHIHSLGRQGRGPGEIASPGSLAVDPDGVVSVFDFAKGSLVRFDPEGNPLPEVPLGLYPWPGPARHIAEIEEGLLVASMLPSAEENTFRHALQLLAGGDTVVLGERSFPQPGMVMYPSCGGGLNLPRIFEAQVTWAAKGGAVALSRSPEYEIEVVRDGEVRRRIRRDMPARVATEALAAAELGDGLRVNFGRGPCTIPPQEMVAGRGHAEFLPWIDQISMAPHEEVWVRRKEVGRPAGGPIDVFDSSGAYMGSLPPDTPFPLVFLDANRFGASEADEFDVSRLVIYEIQRN